MRVQFGLEKFLRLFKTNDNSQKVDILFGSSPAGGDSDEQDNAPIGSLFILQNGANSALYQKKYSTNTTADWTLLIQASNLSWRNEKVIIATGDTLSAGSGIDPTSWTDNESGYDGDDIANGSYVIGDVDGTPTLFQKTAQVSATSITLVAATTAIQDNNTFVIQHYLPDSPAAQEMQAIIHFPTASSAGIKIADFNWALANGINLTGAYVAASGNVVAGDTVEIAIAKLDGNIDAVNSALGVAQGVTNFGSFVPFADLFLAANQTAKQLFQRIGDLFNDHKGVEVTPVTTIATIDSVLHASVSSVKWLVEVTEIATPANKEFVEIHALTDGTSVNDVLFAKLKLGSTGNIASYSVDISGTDMRLRVSSGTAGVKVVCKRENVVKNIL